MGQQLYMIGLTAKDMGKAQEFYQRLGVELPEWKDQRRPLMVKMGEDFTFFLAPRSIEGDKAANGEGPEDYRVLFEYYLKTQAAVEEKYAELVGYGYQSYHAPFIYANGMCFAMVNDPDGNTILLSGEVEKDGTAVDEH